MVLREIQNNFTAPESVGCALPCTWIAVAAAGKIEWGERKKIKTDSMLPFQPPHWSAKRGRKGGSDGGFGWRLSGYPREGRHGRLLTPRTMSPSHMCCYSVTHSCGRRCNWLQLQLLVCFVCLFAGMLLGFWVSQQYNSIQGEQWESAMKSVQKVHLSYWLCCLSYGFVDELFASSDIKWEMGSGKWGWKLVAYKLLLFVAV